MPRPSSQTVTASHSDDDARNEDARPFKRRRKQRPTFSCEECRRLKMRCDRKVPCSNCTRRNRIQFCAPPKDSTSSRQRSRGHSYNGHDLDDHQQPETSLDRTRITPQRPNVVSYGLTHQESSPQLTAHPPAQTSAEGPEQEANHSHRPATSEQDNNRFDNVSLSLGSYAAHAPPIRSTPVVLPDIIPTGSDGAYHPALQFEDQPEEGGSHGTLMLSEGGRSKYLGPTAGSEWLKDSETQDISDTPIVTRAPSPEVPSNSPSLQAKYGPSSSGPIAFPFNASVAYVSTRDLLSQLPPRDEAWFLTESYYRYCAWHHDVAPKRQFEQTFNRVYSAVEGGPITLINPQDIALIFAIMAEGTLSNIELPHYDPSAEQWLYLSERALVKGDFLSNNMLAGLQTLHLMAHLHLQLDKGRRGDNAWPLWGLVMRLAQAMGMHRDGTRWKLPKDVVEERRKVFWECNAADTFQAHCFSRPCSINPEHCDTAFPTEPLGPNGDKSYSILRYELSQLSAEILNMAMKVRKPLYAEVLELNGKLCKFEQNLPFSLRSRAAYLSMPSRYPDINDAINSSPEPSHRSMIHSFQQMSLALNISETIINLHRPYYAKALYDDVEDRINLEYAFSFLIVIERCAIIINLVADIHKRFSAVSDRQWHFWYHVFNSALCLGTLLLRDPGNPMSSYALAQIDTAIDLFNTLIQHGAGTPRYRRNLTWLVRLRARASSRVSAASNAQVPGTQQQVEATNGTNHGSDDLELLGWRTRLIERAGQAHPTVSTIESTTRPIGSRAAFQAPSQDPNDFRGHQGQMGIAEMMLENGELPQTTPNSTDDLLHDFWDPMLLQDVFASHNDRSIQSFENDGTGWWGVR